MILNFYNSALIAKNSDYISSEFREALRPDFCAWAKLPQVARRLSPDKGKPFQALASIRSGCNA